VPRRRSSKAKNQKTDRRLLLGAATAVEEPWTIPTRWLNVVFGVFLLPPAWVLTQTLFTSFSAATLQHEFWATEEFWFFALGSVMWLVAFFCGIWMWGEPRPLRAYIFGHELTHAIWVFAMGGRVSRFKVERTGGYIITDTHNFWIALAPYFYPIYGVAVVIIYGIASVFYDLSAFTPLLCGLIGFTWCFHMSFTLWMIPKGQSDLTYHGTFFSLVIIYLMNLLLLCGFLLIAAPEITWSRFSDSLLTHAGDLASWVWNGAALLVSGLEPAGAAAQPRNYGCPAAADG
jgi:hypothetical protein